MFGTRIGDGTEHLDPTFELSGGLGEDERESPRVLNGESRIRVELEVDGGNVGSSLKAAVFDLNRADADSSRASGGEPVGCVDDAGCDALVQLPFSAERSDWGSGLLTASA